MKRHRNDLPHKCSHLNCSKSYARKSELYVHERSHDNISLHHCQQCGKGFREKSRMTKHYQKCILNYKKE